MLVRLLGLTRSDVGAVMKHEGVRFPCLLQRSCEAVKMKFALYLVLREHKADMKQRHYSAGYELLLPRLLGISLVIIRLPRCHPTAAQLSCVMFGRV